MKIAHLFSARALTPVVAPAMALAILAGPANAQDVHTIVPHYPDAFKAEITRTSDQEQTLNGKHTVTHTQMVLREEVEKAATGYQAVYTAISADADSHGPDGLPVPQAEQQKQMLSLLTNIGAAKVTLDDTMTPVSIDNIEDIKPRIKAALTGTGDASKDATGMKLYDAFIANLTPQSAAIFLKQAHDADRLFNQPMTLHVPTPITGGAVQILGSPFKLSGSMTLDEWNEGKSASVTSVITPSEEDLHAFLSGIMKTVLDRMAPESNVQSREILDNMVKQMHMGMTETCHTTIDLVDFVANHTECDIVTSIDLDLARAFPADILKAVPKLAQLPPMTMVQKQHTVTDARLVP